MSAAELFYRLADDRLRRRTRWAGAVIAASVLWPYEVVEGQPQFLWQIAAELPISAVVAAIAPALAGIVVLLAGWRGKRAASVALTVIAALVATSVVRRLGAEAAAWGLLPMPRSFTDRASLALVALAASAAGSNLSQREGNDARRATRMLVALAMLASVVFYGWPGRGEAPGVTVFRNLALLPDMPSFRFQLGLLTLAFVALWPAIVSLAALGHLRWPAKRTPSAVAMAALLGFPLILMMLLFSWFMRASPGAALFGAMGAALEIAAVIHVFAAALEVLGETAITKAVERDEPSGWVPRRAAGLALGVTLAIAGGQWWLARPPRKGIDWAPGASSPAADELFGEHIARWSSARARWDRKVRRDSSASDLLEVKASGQRMVDAGAALDAGLGTALDALAQAAYQLDTSSRRWYRLVADVNAELRRSGLPYYLDPRVSLAKSKDGLVRHFVVDSYGVERVRRWQADGQPLSTLQVRALAGPGGGHHHGLLGLSRDQQPFALVVLDAADDHLADLAEMVATSPPTCGETAGSASEEATRACGAWLAAQMADPEAAAAVVGAVERHELQHQIDGPLLALAPSVRRKLAGYTDAAQERANRELSAYLAQLTAPGNVRLGLVLPFRFALLTDRGTYHHAAVLTFEALVGRSIRSESGRVLVAELANAFEELTRLDDEGLRGRASAAWGSQFGGRLAPATLVDEILAGGG
jgi:hypothetical protein